MTEIDDLAQRLARAHRIIWAGGLLPLTKGHISARIDDDRLLILGHIHAHRRTLDTTTERDLVVIDADGNDPNTELRAVGERYIHTAVYGARDDVGAIVHCHAPYATALATGGVNVLPVGNRGGIFAPTVEILAFDGQIESPETGALVSSALGDGAALVLRNHGIVAVGATIEQAVVTAFALEETAQMQFVAAVVGQVEPLSDAECARVSRGGPDHAEFFSHVWAHYESLDPMTSRARAIPRSRAPLHLLDGRPQP